MFLGLIKWFDPEKGFGAIGTAHDGEFFLHINTLIDKSIALTKERVLVFEKQAGQANQRPKALACRGVSLEEDFFFILQSVADTDRIPIVIETRVKNKYGKVFTTKDIYQAEIKRLALNQLFKRTPVDLVKSYITAYFDKSLDKEEFIPFCHSIQLSICQTFASPERLYVLDAVYAHFKQEADADLLFNVWKNRAFTYLGYPEVGDYEIPEEIFRSHADELGIPALTRIQAYSFGKEFCSDVATQRIEAILQDNPDQRLPTLKVLAAWVEHEPGERYRLLINGLITQACRSRIQAKAAELGSILTVGEYDRYTQLKLEIGPEINEADRATLTAEINAYIREKSDETFYVHLWLNGLMETVARPLLNDAFLSGEANQRLLILHKLPADQQLELLKSYSAKQGYEKTFKLLERYLTRFPKPEPAFTNQTILPDPALLSPQKGDDLLTLFNDYTQATASQEELYDLFFKGLSKTVPLGFVRTKIAGLDQVKCTKLVSAFADDYRFIEELLTDKSKLASKTDLYWILALAKQQFTPADFTKLDDALFTLLTPAIYFELWEKGFVFRVPNDFIITYLDANPRHYTHIQEWIASKRVSVSHMRQLFLDFLASNQLVTDRTLFYRHYYYIRTLLDFSASLLEDIEQTRNEFCQVLLWFLDRNQALNFELLASKFIYFSPDDQVRIVRKLFHLKASGQLELSIEQLQQLTRVDLDLYRLNLQFNPEVCFDISTEVILTALANFEKTGKFLVEGELLSLALSSTATNRTRQFQLQHYFEACAGRSTEYFDWAGTNGILEKVPFGNNQFYFSLKFDYSETLVDEVKKIPGRKWNNEEKVWGVPARYEAEVVAFARKNRFQVNVGPGTKLSNNLHLVTYRRGEVPPGIAYCEGRLANQPDPLLHKPFWWCANQKCQEKCETHHTAPDWASYTLLDFCELLGLNTDETNHMNDFIPYGRYYQFMGLINRFNRLLKKLYCTECKEILHPVYTSHFAAYTVVRFCCTNTGCGQHDKTIYLNHCLNGQCNAIIDSRVSKKCKNGLYICDTCGSCCSHNMLERRLSNLRTTRGYVHPDLEYKVLHKLGHLERGVYFCYNCAGLMKEGANECFNCPRCQVSYETAPYRFKRIHKHLNRPEASTHSDEFEGDSFPDL